jgi:hypothetical protein
MVMYVLHGIGEEMEEGKRRKTGNITGGGDRFKGPL